MGVEIPRDYRRFNEYLNNLNADIYSQPPDPGHTLWATSAIEWWKPSGKVLDIGCGSGFCYKIFHEYKVDYTGVTASLEDIKIAANKGIKVTFDDMTFSSFEDNSFDAVFARHVLEHSPFPIITLMEWRRLSKKHLMLVCPAPDFWGWGGRNHYSVADKMQIFWWLRRSGWDVIRHHDFITYDLDYVESFSDNQKRLEKGEDIVHPGGAPKVVEYWILCEKGLGSRK
jgi:SAM-dependent methyltransferase